MTNSTEAFEALRPLQFDTVLDIGSGDGYHAKEFRKIGKNVVTLDIAPPANFVADYMEINLKDFNFNLIWCSHTLEHQANPNLFLKKIFNELSDNGYLAITVPPLKHEIVGGHVTLWNMGILLYNLILAGFDCSEAKAKKYGYNISVIVRKKPAVLPRLKCDFGDIEVLSEFFPIPVHNGFNGDIEEINW